MPICRSSIPDRAALTALAFLLSAGMPATAQSNIANAAAQAEASFEPGTVASDTVLKRRRPSNEAPRPDIPTGPSQFPARSLRMEKRAFQAMRHKLDPAPMEARARRAQAQASDELAKEREAMAARLHAALGLEPPVADVRIPPPDAGARATAWVPVIFASSSMPIETLRNYMAQLEKAGGVMAFRGVPGGLAKMGPMAALTARMLRLDPGCEGPACAMRSVQIVVDPILFRQHGVNRVPTLAMVPGDPTQPYCEREDEAAPKAAHLVEGDAALSGLFEEYARLGGKEEVRNAAARLSRR